MFSPISPLLSHTGRIASRETAPEKPVLITEVFSHYAALDSRARRGERASGLMQMQPSWGALPCPGRAGDAAPRGLACLHARGAASQQTGSAPHPAEEGAVARVASPHQRGGAHRPWGCPVWPRACAPKSSPMLRRKPSANTSIKGCVSLATRGTPWCCGRSQWPPSSPHTRASTLAHSHGTASAACGASPLWPPPQPPCRRLAQEEGRPRSRAMLA